jgi:hypothetical protein
MFPLRRIANMKTTLWSPPILFERRGKKEDGKWEHNGGGELLQGTL